jgi:hypothetical protein
MNCSIVDNLYNQSKALRVREQPIKNEHLNVSNNTPADCKLPNKAD